jgi:hypothetical protein
MPLSVGLERWWPLPASLDLASGRVDHVASAVLAEVTRFVGSDGLSSMWVPFESPASVFETVSEFTIPPTVFFVLPTHSNWSVLWNNCFACDGYDSLCACLTKNHGLTTVHWQSSDQDAFFQAGSLFTARRRSGIRVLARTVYCCKNEADWEFHVSGEPLPEEDTTAYAAPRTRDRLNEQGMMALLSRLGAQPWEESFYRVGKAFRIQRVSLPSAITRKKFGEVARTRL